MHRPSDSWAIGGFYLANGKPLSKENIDIPVLLNLNNVQRAFSSAGVPPSVNMTVTEHSYLCFLIAGRLCGKFPGLVMALDESGIGVAGFMAYVMAHDIQESLVGDVPTPLKNDAFREFEERVAMGVRDFLSLDTAKANYLYQPTKICDLISSLYECKFATDKGYDLSLIYSERYKTLLGLVSAGSALASEHGSCITYQANMETPIDLIIDQQLLDEFIAEIVP